MKISAALLGIVAGISLCSATAADTSSKPYPVLRTFQAGDAFWDYAVYDSSAHRIYIGRENGVTTIDLDSGKVNPQFIEGKQVHAVVLLDHNRALATNGGLAKAVIFNRTTGKILSEIPTGMKPDGAAVEPATGQIVIMDGISHDIVFADPALRAKLNGIVHPLVRARMQELEDAAAPGAVVVQDVPLIAENNLAGAYDLVVVVDVPPRIQLDRLVRHRAMTREQAQARMAAQASRADRLAIAGIVIDNSGTLAELDRLVGDLWTELRRRAQLARNT